MTRNNRLPAASAAFVLGGLLLAGCTGKDPTLTSASEPSAASPTPSALPMAVVVPPQRPELMDDDGPAGAEAAAQYFLMLDAYMQATGDTSEWAAMSHESCGFCAARLEQAQEVASSEYAVVGGEVTVDIVHTYAQDPTTGIWPIDITTTMRPVELKDATGMTVDGYPAGSVEQRIEMGRRDGRWVVIGVGDRPAE